MRLVTHQTGPEGKIVQRLLIEETLPIERELYLGIVVDRATARPVFMASAAGGMEIEEVAAKDPKAIIKEAIDPTIGFQAYHARKLAFGLGLKAEQINEAVRLMTGLYRAFVDTDASLCEINPFITTTDGRLFALDAKFGFDDNALYRHKDLKELRDISEEDPLEVEASKYNLNYIKLDGNIACLVNGAGLAMATMDIIKYAGGSPANFLDVGGGANAEQIGHAFEILLSDKNVKADPDQYFWRHFACGHAGRWRGAGGQGDEPEAAAGAAPGRHERGKRARDPEELRPELPGGGDDERRSGKSCGGSGRIGRDGVVGISSSVSQDAPSGTNNSETAARLGAGAKEKKPWQFWLINPRG